MAEARAICSKGWPITLLALVCCAAEADVLSPEDADMPSFDAENADAGGGGFLDATPTWDPLAYADASSEGGYNPAPYFDAGNVPTWTSCDPRGSIFERARNGDACNFTGPVSDGCGELVGTCGMRKAVCVNGVLQLGMVSKDVCEPDDLMNARRCDAMETANCCVTLWQCDGVSNDPTGRPKMRVCSLSCETQPSFPETQARVTSCPNDPDAPAWPRGWPPPLGLPCAGSFICDSAGNPAGPDTAFRLDQYGLIYWCENGVVQRAAIGEQLPWNEPRP